MTDQMAVDRSEVAAMRAELDRLKQMVQRGHVGGPVTQGPFSGADAMAAADFQRIAQPDIGAPPRSHPLGYLEGANYEQKARMKLEAMAKAKGGRRDADPVIPSVYAGEWTPEEEHRCEFALGLRSDLPDPLDKPEAPGTQLSDRNATRAEVQARQGRRPAS